ADGVRNGTDNCVTTANPTQSDFDQDGQGDACDADDDDDGTPDANDAYPLDASETSDADGDGIGDNADPNDNDGPFGDLDADGVRNGTDNCVTTANPTQSDFDQDGQGDACDADDDKDGVPDASDAFPFNSGESVDTDHDGIGNNADGDDDGDGDGDATDCAPLNAAIHHGATEIGGNSIDDNCNGQVDESAASLVFGGLQAPYAAPPSSFKVGRTIPLTWQYTDAAGAVIGSAAASPTVHYGPVACGASSGGATLDIDSPGNSGLHYDAATMTWQLNWKTTGVPAGCYAIVITSPIAQSSTVIPIQFK
ncbi:MAG: thrombospondin type 3 repeat-containing protein, partial [Bryobacteraceae bacterium]